MVAYFAFLGVNLIKVSALAELPAVERDRRYFSGES